MENNVSEIIKNCYEEYNKSCKNCDKFNYNCDNYKIADRIEYIYKYLESPDDIQVLTDKLNILLDLYYKQLNQIQLKENPNLDIVYEKKVGIESIKIMLRYTEKYLYKYECLKCSYVDNKIHKRCFECKKK